MALAQLIRSIEPQAQKTAFRQFPQNGGGPGMNVAAVASRAHILTGDFCCAFRRLNFAQGQGFSSPPGGLTRTQIIHTKKAPRRVLSFVWRWARDSNPGNLSVQRFSRPPLSTTQPAHQNSHDASLEKRRIIAGLFPRSSVGRLIFLD